MPSFKHLATLLFLLAQLGLAAFAQVALPPTPVTKLALNPLTQKLYVANTDANTVTAMDIASGASTTIAVGRGPSFIAVNPVTNRVYVNNGRDASLSVIDGATDTLLNTYPIGSLGPITVNPVTNVIYIVRMTSAATDEVTFFNGNSNTWYSIATQSFQPTAMAVNPVTNKIYIAHYATGDIRIIDGTYNDRNDHPATVSRGMWSKPFAVAVDHVINKVFVITEDARGPIAVVNGADNTVVFPAVPAGTAQQPRALVVNPITHKAYAAFANEVIVIDGATNALTSIPIANAGSGGIALAIDYATNRIFAATALGTLSVIDGNSDTVFTTQSIAPGATSIAVNPVTRGVFLFGTSLETIARPPGGVDHANPLTTTITPLPGNASPPSGTITLTAASSFSPSAMPLRAVYYRLDSLSGPWTAATGSGPYTASFAGLAPGSHTLHAFAVDGQEAPLATGQHSDPLIGAIASYTFTVANPKVDPSVSLSSSSNPSVQHQGVTFTASVAGSAGTPTGTVAFRSGSVDLAGCGAIALAGGVAACAIDSLPPGTTTVRAHYSGDGAYNAAASAGLDQVVRLRAQATITISSSANPSVAGQAVTFTADASGEAGVPTGTVDFVLATTNMAGCTAVPLAGGRATCTTSSLPVGSHSISVRYSGDAAYGTGGSPIITQTVTAAPVQRTLTVARAGGGAGTVTSSPAGIDCGATCSAAFASGTAVTLSAVPAAGSRFAGWSGACTGTSACTVTLDAAASVTATFEVQVSDPPRLGNLSTRMQVLTGNDVLIGGFIVGGASSKTVVIRARGPSLTAFGIANPLANPTLQLVRSSDQSTLATNDDWQDAANAAAIGASGFAPSNALESAILVTLEPGAYTAIVAGAGGGTGVGMFEVFEVDRRDIPLVNIATRGPVLGGDGAMIGGFVVQGDGPQTVVIRARGPSLAAFGVGNPLANPTLRIVRSSDQSVIADNDDWRGAANAAQIAATGFAPGNDLESAVLVTLQPGAYTAIVSGVGGGTGVGIVEVFTVD